jgi:hypothetical protein
MKKMALLVLLFLSALFLSSQALADSYINWHTDYMPGMGPYDTGEGNLSDDVYGDGYGSGHGSSYVELCIPTGPVTICADNQGHRSAYIYPGLVHHPGPRPGDNAPELPLLGPLLGGVGRGPVIQPYPGPFPLLDAVGNDMRYLFPWVWLQPEAWSETWPQP